MFPRFLTLDEILQIHEHEIASYGGHYGIRDIDLLLSALSQPEMTFEGELLHNDPYKIAAAYLFHIVKNHPFIDGNKRVGTMACLMFLRLNGIPLGFPEPEFAEIVEGVAVSTIDKEQLASWLKNANEND